VLLISLAAVLTLGCANLHLRRPKESRLVLELKRRRRLMTQLRRVVDNEEDASRLLRIEATRLKDTARSERVLISAIARANRGPGPLAMFVGRHRLINELMQWNFTQ
jgi:hypothetical protein